MVWWLCLKRLKFPQGKAGTTSKYALEMPGASHPTRFSRREGTWCCGRVTGIVCHHTAIETNPALKIEKTFASFSLLLAPTVKTQHRMISNPERRSSLTLRRVLAPFPTHFACWAAGCSQLCHGEVCWVFLHQGGRGLCPGPHTAVLSRLEFSAAPQASRNALGRLLNLLLCFLPLNENCFFSQQNVERASDSKVLLAEAVMPSAV